MPQDRKIDIQIAEKVLGQQIIREKHVIRETLASGQTRPLRTYSSDISAAWEVVEKLGMTLIPVEAGWFALVGHSRPWASPAEFLIYLQKADFATSGAAVGESAPLTICLAAIKSLEKREFEPVTHSQQVSTSLDEGHLAN